MENTFNNQRVLITGANGFIGSHVVQRMVQEKALVSVIVRESSDLWRIEELKKEIDINLVDLRDSASIDKCVKSLKPDFVFHVGAYGVDSRQKDYSTAANTNIMGTMNLLNSVKDIGCKKFINVGTCMEYGDKQEIIRENSYLEPDSIYGSTKASATIIAHQIAKENNINLVTLRPFGIFGEKEGSHKFFPYIILSILEGKDVNLTPCEQYRDYCYIENIMDGFVLAAKNETVNNEIFNIGSGEIFKLKHFVDIIYNQMRSTKQPNYGALPYRQNEVWRQQPDTNKMKRLLNWEPKVSLEEGIKRTINWYETNTEKFVGTKR
ncbi:NAD(P)-dependent oxidoreductase [Bacillus sp. HNG]|uniref:NAD-dependent epimerase/dehydratase family protein n=1 Tax=Bacillus sp. HNG TaxID=2293325 RepID=UPI000E2F3977|nr:NAD(P)-dependent oxidoreductase [Bacillus sp. HNG]RFB18930.1 NAD(P)-dependent oxidoreductase [Bacillus sp. HNG]